MFKIALKRCRILSSLFKEIRWERDLGCPVSFFMKKVRQRIAQNSFRLHHSPPHDSPYTPVDLVFRKLHRWPQWTLEHTQCTGFVRRSCFGGAAAAWPDSAARTVATVLVTAIGIAYEFSWNSMLFPSCCTWTIKYPFLW